MVNNKRPSELFPEIQIDLVKMADSGRKAKKASSQGKRSKSTSKYDQRHFLHTHYIYDFYRKHTLDKSITKTKQKQRLRMKAMILLRLDSMRRSGGISRIPTGSITISPNGKSLEFKIYMPKGAQQRMTGAKANKRISRTGFSTTLKVFQSNNGNKDCCVVQAVVDYMEATKEDREEAYTRGVTIKGSTVEATADYLFISVSRCKRSIKGNMVPSDNDGISTFRKVSGETISNTVMTFLQSHLFPSIPKELLTKELRSVTPHVLRHWASSNFAFRLNLKEGKDSPIKEYFLNLAGWIDDTEFFRTYNIIPPTAKSNSRDITNLARIADRLRLTSVSANPL